MRKTITALAALATLGGGIASAPGTAHAAEKPCVGRSVSDHPAEQKGWAYCRPGTAGWITVKIVCMRESNFKTYIEYGKRVHDKKADPDISKAWCNGIDALVSHHAEVG
jgi:hypothetical protein